MNKVYTIVWESYGYMDDEFSSTVDVFNDLESAKIYFEMMKTNIIKEYLDYTDYETIEGLIDDEYFYMDETPVLSGDEYLYIEYDEYGRDKLRIYEKPVMKFNESVATMLSCKMSIKANTNITIEEMEGLIDDLRQCNNPFNCPHGRPSIIHFSIYELEKMFKRSI